MSTLPLLPPLALAACQGRKTQTRTLMKPYPPADTERMDWHRPADCWQAKRADNDIAGLTLHLGDFRAPYTAGQRVPLLTSWAVGSGMDSWKPKLIHPDAAARAFWHAGMGEKPEVIKLEDMGAETWAGKTRPGRFLPLTLRHLMPQFEIVSCVPQRLQDITEDEARAEGCEAETEYQEVWWQGYDTRIKDRDGNFHHNEFKCEECPSWLESPRRVLMTAGGNITARTRFQRLIETIYPGAWAANKWCWKTTFRRVTT